MSVERLDAAIDVLLDLRNNKNKIVLDIVRQHEKDVLDLNKKQLGKGENPKGELIKPDYSQRYAAYKKDRGLRHDRVTLYLEGDFYAGFKIEFRNDGFIIISTDGKYKKLVTKYGDVLGLSENSIKALCLIVLKTLQKETREKFFSKLGTTASNAT